MYWYYWEQLGWAGRIRTLTPAFKGRFAADYKSLPKKLVPGTGLEPI